MKQTTRLLSAILTLWLYLTAPPIASAQDHTVKCIVKDAQGQTIAGASVYIKGTKQGYMNRAAQTGRIAAEMVTKIAAHPPRKGEISILHQIKKEKIS